jgi:hypothetical protein
MEHEEAEPAENSGAHLMIPDHQQSKRFAADGAGEFVG